MYCALENRLNLVILKTHSNTSSVFGVFNLFLGHFSLDGVFSEFFLGNAIIVNQEQEKNAVGKVCRSSLLRSILMRLLLDD